MILFLSQSTVFMFAVALIGLAVNAILFPNKTILFLSKFASTARLHIVEMIVRLVVGIAFVIAAPEMLFHSLFYLFGLVLIITSVLLLMMPWRWHHQFAVVVLAPLLRRVWVFAVLSLPLGIFIFIALFRIEFA
ncbi:hypothetical protein [Aliiglaciecola litoralis]|uniref:Uncharacterized protein n=1 Tax=Aliiglaciecola litoralis TaxID=582857 RepID=A0ABN1LMT6_9ALTE